MDVNRDSKRSFSFNITSNLPCTLDFYDVLPTILQDINEADFVAFDGEFTGILPFDRMNYFDTPAERYQRHYDVRKASFSAVPSIFRIILVW